MHTDTVTPATMLVLVGDAVDAEDLLDVVGRLADGETAILVVAPAPAPRPRPAWRGGHDARDEAKERLQGCVERLDGAGLDATGMLGDADPLQALRAALSWFPAELLVVATPRRSRRPETHVAERAGRYFAGPIVNAAVGARRPRAGPERRPPLGRRVVRR